MVSDMPDSEVFKIILNGGSFAMLILIFCWALFKLEPRIREMMEKKDAEHNATVKLIVEQHRLSMEKMIEKFADSIERKDKECREERKEWQGIMTKEGDQNRALIAKEGELNRQSRHDIAREMQRIVAEIYSSLPNVPHPPTKPKSQL